MLFHPLASLSWEKLLAISQKSPTSRVRLPDYHNVVIHGDKIYIGGHYMIFEITLNTASKSASLTEMTAPCSNFTLSTYLSRLVIVGGREWWSSGQHELSPYEITNKVWTSDDGVKWETSLPPMPTRRADASAVNPSSSQCLVVAGGVIAPKGPVLTDVVEVLRDQHWSTVQSLPAPRSEMRSTLHNGNWYLLGQSDMCCCNLNKLLHDIHQARKESKLSLAPLPSKVSAWSLVPFSKFRYHADISTSQQFSDSHIYIPQSPVFVSVGQDLVALGHYIAYGYCRDSRRWLCVGYMPDRSSNRCVAVLPSGEVLLLIQQRLGDPITVYRLSLRVSPYDADSHFNMSALYKIHWTSFPLFPQLVEISALLAKYFGYKTLMDMIKFKPTRQVVTTVLMMEEWLKREHSDVPPPTWRSLLGLMRQQGLEDLSVRIKSRLTDVQSLQERCMSVIMSALLSQWTLTPDQLHTALPSYVPTLTKKDIVDCFKRETSLTTYGPEDKGTDDIAK